MGAVGDVVDGTSTCVGDGVGVGNNGGDGGVPHAMAPLTHIPVLQSESARHFLPGLHLPQVVPQSISVSLPPSFWSLQSPHKTVICISDENPRNGSSSLTRLPPSGLLFPPPYAEPGVGLPFTLQ